MNRGHQHARFEQPAVDGVHAQQPERASVTRGIVALYPGCATEPRKPAQATATRMAQIVPAAAKATIATVSTHWAEGRPAGDPARAVSVGQRAAERWAEDIWRKARQDVERRGLGLMRELQEQDGERDDGQPVAIRRDAGSHEEAP